MGPLSWGLIYFYAWNDNPDFFISGIDEADDQIRPILTPRHIRLHHVGITAAYATAFSGVPMVGELPPVFRVEGLLSSGVKFADSRQQTAADATVPMGNTRSGTISAGK